MYLSVDSSRNPRNIPCRNIHNRNIPCRNIHNRNIHNRNIHNRNIHNRNIHNRNIHNRNIHCRIRVYSPAGLGCIPFRIRVYLLQDCRVFPCRNVCICCRNGLYSPAGMCVSVAGMACIPLQDCCVSVAGMCVSVAGMACIPLQEWGVFPCRNGVYSPAGMGEISPIGGSGGDTPIRNLHKFYKFRGTVLLVTKQIK